MLKKLSFIACCFMSVVFAEPTLTVRTSDGVEVKLTADDISQLASGLVHAILGLEKENPVQPESLKEFEGQTVPLPAVSLRTFDQILKLARDDDKYDKTFRELIWEIGKENLGDFFAAANYLTIEPLQKFFSEAIIPEILSELLSIDHNVAYVKVEPEYFIVIRNDNTAQAYDTEGKAIGSEINEVENVYTAPEYFVVREKDNFGFIYDKRGNKLDYILSGIKTIYTQPEYFIARSTPIQLYSPDTSGPPHSTIQAYSVTGTDEKTVKPIGPRLPKMSANVIPDHYIRIATAPEYFIAVDDSTKTAQAYSVTGNEEKTVKTFGDTLTDIKKIHAEPEYFVAEYTVKQGDGQFSRQTDDDAQAYSVTGNEEKIIRPITPLFNKLYGLYTSPDYFLYEDENEGVKAYDKEGKVINVHERFTFDGINEDDITMQPEYFVLNYDPDDDDVVFRVEGKNEKTIDEANLDLPDGLKKLLASTPQYLIFLHNLPNDIYGHDQALLVYSKDGTQIASLINLAGRISAAPDYFVRREWAHTYSEQNKISVFPIALLKMLNEGWLENFLLRAFSAHHSGKSLSINNPNVEFNFYRLPPFIQNQLKRKKWVGGFES